MVCKHFSSSRPEIELRLLQFLADATADDSCRTTLIRTLANYTWLDADNEILFEAIRVLFAQAPRDILNHLPAALTRNGFPDISCEPLRQGSLLAPADAVALAGELLRSAK